MAVAERTTPAQPTTSPTTRRLEIAFVLRSLSSLRCFQSSLELLVERGHDVRLVLVGRTNAPREEAWVERMLERPGFSCEIASGLRNDPWHKRAVALWTAMEYVNRLEPSYAGRARYLRKALHRSPPSIVPRLARLPFVRTPRGLRLLYSVIAAVERALPPPRRVVDYLERLAPDLLVLGDYASRGSLHSTFVRLAKARGIPVATFVASWDNLTTRPRMRAIPHRLVVWNETQRREAVELHGVPADRVAVTGAPNFDQWFDWKPRPREEFLARVGLDPAKAFVLWVGGALFDWEQPEAVFVSRWLDALRSSGNPSLARVSVLVRPHPRKVKEWRDADFSAFGDVAVWPRGPMSMPVDAEQKADYYDSIYHSAAVVGINTSAMIEAAIVGRPVLSVLVTDHFDSQAGAVHFSYLRDGGAVRIAETLDEHLDQLASAVAGVDGGERAAAERFVAEFVRPHGLDRAATPFVVEALEQLAAAEIAQERDPVWVALLRRLILLVTLPDTLARGKRAQRSLKRIRKRLKRARRPALRLAYAVRARLR